MSGELRYTEKEMVMARRESYKNGAICWVAELRTRQAAAQSMILDGTYSPAKVLLAEITQDAAEKHPLPKVERPRVVTDKQGAEWRVIGDVAQVRFDADYTWESRPIVSMTKDRALLIADLFARPSEFVDDEG